MTTRASLILVRHPPVDARYCKCCYGSSDIPLGKEGAARCRQLAKELRHQPASIIIHSGLERTRRLAEVLADQRGVPCISSPSLRERSFGNWELQTWDAIYSSTGDDMLRTITEPATFRPGGGETTAELQQRVADWFSSLPQNDNIIAVTHGGPIGALLGQQMGLAIEEWVKSIPACGTWVTIDRQTTRSEHRGAT